MTSMHVYYDANGDIKAVTPAINDEFKKTYLSATFPLAEVDKFLTGQKNPFNYCIKDTIRNGVVLPIIAEKESAITLTRTLDTYLTKVDTTAESSLVKITANTDIKSISIRIDAKLKEMQQSGTDDEQDDVSNFIRHGQVFLYFTEENNPYNLFHTVVFHSGELFKKGELYFKYDPELDLSRSSVYTKKLIHRYGYKIKG